MDVIALTVLIELYDFFNTPLAEFMGAFQHFGVVISFETHGTFQHATQLLHIHPFSHHAVPREAPAILNVR